MLVRLSAFDGVFLCAEPRVCGAASDAAVMGSTWTKRALPIKSVDRGPGPSKGAGWLGWILQCLMVRLFSVRRHPPMIPPHGDNGRGDIGNFGHYYRLNGAISGAHVIMAGLIGSAKCGRLFARWSCFPVITRRSASWCSGLPGVLSVPQTDYEEAMARAIVIGDVPRHADFPGHRIAIAQHDDSSSENEESNDDNDVAVDHDDEGGIAKYQTPRKRRRVA